jgi:hypothetical protein
LVKSKYRKGSLSRNDEAFLSLSNPSNTSPGIQAPIGSTALNYSNSTASSSGASHGNSNSRKSLISNPINFQHIHHMGPNDGKSFMTSDLTSPTSIHGNNGLPPLSSSTRIITVSAINNSNLSDTNSLSNIQNSNTSKKSSSSSGMRHIAKNEISAPTNFRHIVKGLDDFNISVSSNGSNKDIIQNKSPNQNSNSPSNPSNDTNNSQNKMTSRVVNQSESLNNSPKSNNTSQANSNNQLPIIQPKSSSLSSSSSSSSSILHSPNSPNSANNENLSQAINNTLKASSVLYNGNYNIFD